MSVYEVGALRVLVFIVFCACVACVSFCWRVGCAVGDWFIEWLTRGE